VVPVPKADLPVKLPDDVEFDRPGNPLDRHPTWKHVKCPQCGKLRPGARPTRWTPSSIRPGISPASPHPGDDEPPTAPVRSVAAGRPVYRRHRARDPAPALFALLHPRHEEDRPCRPGRAVRRPVHARHGRARDLQGQRPNGKWLFAGEVEIEPTARRAPFTIGTGEPVEIGPRSRRCRSRRRTRSTPEDIIDTYGADTARWFMLSDSPPERDVEWTEDGVEGAWRFTQRLWRLVGEAVELSEAGQAQPEVIGPEADALRRATHKLAAHVEDDIDRLRFNVAVARIHGFANVFAEAISTARKNTEKTGDKPSDDLAFALREAATFLVAAIGPMIPHLAEECWIVLGREGLAAEAPWPVVDAALLVEDQLVLPIQINGKKRAELTISATASETEIEAATLALDGVIKALEGRVPRKIVIVPKRIVNVVV
jgi:leucyl-tRNA synthetase